MSAAKAETNRVRADAQRLQRTVEELQTTNFDYKKFVQTITEEDDAIRDQLEAMYKPWFTAFVIAYATCRLATGLGVFALLQRRRRLLEARREPRARRLCAA